jgi:hypothetical protein
MSVFTDLVKNNVAAIGATVTIITTLTGGILAIESRYAKAEDVNSVKQYVIKSHEFTKYELHQSIDTDRKENLEDKLYELRSKSTQTSSDKAMIKRYEDRLSDIKQRLSTPAPSAPSMDVQQPTK